MDKKTSQETELALNDIDGTELDRVAKAGANYKVLYATIAEWVAKQNGKGASVVLTSFPIDGTTGLGTAVFAVGHTLIPPGDGSLLVFINENSKYFIVPFNGVIKNLTVTVAVDVLNDDVSIKVRKNSADTSLELLSMDTGGVTTTLTDSTHIVSVTAGDGITIDINVASSNPFTAGLGSISFELEKG